MLLLSGISAVSQAESFLKKPNHHIAFDTEKTKVALPHKKFWKFDSKPRLTDRYYFGEVKVGEKYHSALIIDNQDYFVGIQGDGVSIYFRY